MCRLVWRTTVKHKVLHPRFVYNNLDWSVYTRLTQLYDGRDMYIIYYIKNNYMFRHFSLAIFRLINEKNLVSSYTRLVCVVYSGEVRGEVGRMCGCVRQVYTLQSSWLQLRSMHSYDIRRRVNSTVPSILPWRRSLRYPFDRKEVGSHNLSKPGGTEKYPCPEVSWILVLQSRASHSNATAFCFYLLL